MDYPAFLRYVLAALVAFGLSYHGLSNKSLSLSGGLAAIFVGFSSFACSIRFGFILILFYYTSSKFTKWKQEYKASIEEDYAVGGQRNWMQVLASSALATAAALMYYFLCGEDTHISFGAPQAEEEVINLTFITLPKSTLATYLWVLYIAHYCTANADTWASELGVLSTHEPRLVTSLFLRAVPRGTNGGMSLFGTAASAAGGLFIGAVFWVFSLLLPSTSSPRGVPQSAQYPILLFSLLCGLLGSLVDSLLGATLQATYYSKDRKCIVKQHVQRVPDAVQDGSIVRVCGMDILSNEAVNLLSIFITMILSLWLAPNVFCWQDATQCYEVGRMNRALYGVLGALWE
jgi:uncharacterized membrane protein